MLYKPLAQVFYRQVGARPPPPPARHSADPRAPSRQAQSVVLVFDVKNRASFKALGAVGGWVDEFTRLTGLSARNFPFVLVGNKAEEDMMHSRQVYEEDVRDWLHKEGGRMPYIETSLTGDPKLAWRNAERVFRTVARTVHRTRENLGRHQPPETVRTVEEPDHTDEVEGIGALLGAEGPSLAERLEGRLRTLADNAGGAWNKGVRALQEKVESLPLPGADARAAAKAAANELATKPKSAPAEQTAAPIIETKLRQELRGKLKPARKTA